MERYIKNNKLTIFLVFSAVLTGIVIGTFSLLKLDENLAKSLIDSVNSSISNSSLFAAFTKSISSEFLKFFALFICGITVFGAPMSVFCLGYLGYTLGFSVGFLMKYYGLAGYLSVIFGIIPHYLILLPAYILTGIVGINFSNKLLLGEKQLKNDFKLYTAKMIFFAVMIFLSCIIEGFVSSFFIKKILLLI